LFFFLLVIVGATAYGSVDSNLNVLQANTH